jgi:hypothetical protein
MGKTILDWLKEMSQQKTSQPPPQGCRRWPLPEFWELPRRFGFLSGCLEERDGVKYAVFTFTIKGLKGRYVFVAEPWNLEYIRRGLQRKERRGAGESGLPQILVDALVELGGRHAVELAKDRATVDGMAIPPDVCHKERIVERCAAKIEQLLSKWRRLNPLLEEMRTRCPDTAEIVEKFWRYDFNEELVRGWCDMERMLAKYNLTRIIPFHLLSGHPPIVNFVKTETGQICAMVHGYGSAECQDGDYRVEEVGNKLLLYKPGSVITIEATPI